MWIPAVAAMAGLVTSLTTLADGAVPTIKETRRVASAWARFQKRAHQGLRAGLAGTRSTRGLRILLAQA